MRQNTLDDSPKYIQHSCPACGRANGQAAPGAVVQCRCGEDYKVTLPVEQNADAKQMPIQLNTAQLDTCVEWAKNYSKDNPNGLFGNYEARLFNLQTFARSILNNSAAPVLLEALELAHHNLPSIPSYSGSEVEACVLAALQKAKGGAA